MGLFGFGKKEETKEVEEAKFITSYTEIPQMVELVDNENYRGALGLINSMDSIHQLESEHPGYSLDTLSIGQSIRYKAIDICPNISSGARQRLFDFCFETKRYNIPKHEFYKYENEDFDEDHYLHISNKFGYNEFLYYIKHNPNITFTEKKFVGINNAYAQGLIDQIDLIGAKNKFMYKYADKIFEVDSVDTILNRISVYSNEDEYDSADDDMYK